MASLGLQPTYAPTNNQAQSTEYDERRDRIKHGQCGTCGIQTHKVSFLFKSHVPITDEHALRGRCLQCYPLAPNAAAASALPATSDAPGASVVAVPSGDEPPHHGQHLNIEGGNGELSAVASVHDAWWKRRWVWVVVGALVFIFAILVVLLSSLNNGSGNNTGGIGVGQPSERTPPTTSPPFISRPTWYQPTPSPVWQPSGQTVWQPSGQTPPTTSPPFTSRPAYQPTPSPHHGRRTSQPRAPLELVVRLMCLFEMETLGHIKSSFCS